MQVSLLTRKQVFKLFSARSEDKAPRKKGGIIVKLKKYDVDVRKYYPNLKDLTEDQLKNELELHGFQLKSIGKLRKKELIDMLITHYDDDDDEVENISNVRFRRRKKVRFAMEAHESSINGCDHTSGYSNKNNNLTKTKSKQKEKQQKKMKCDSSGDNENESCNPEEINPPPKKKRKLSKKLNN